ncbi:MAG: hypothetical protein P8X74_20150, partial [Reinekea sp.]
MRKPLIPICFPKIGGEPMGAPAIFDKQIEIKLLHPASTEGVTDSGFICGIQPNVTLVGRLSSVHLLTRRYTSATRRHAQVCVRLLYKKL